MTTTASSRYKDIISKSVLIRSKPCATYQLKPKKEEIGTLTRMTVGEKSVNKTNRTILLVGETGAGKSTLINALVNYTMGVKWEDEVWFQIIVKEKNENKSKCQTSDVIVYEIFGFEDKTLPYSLTIIDTPGYGETDHNDIVSQRLLKLFQSDDGVSKMYAVGLVMKVSENRLHARLMYIFDSVMSLFGKDVERNIVALITNSDGRRPKSALKAVEVANVKCAKNEKNYPVHFLFDNCQDQERTEENVFCLRNAWKVSENGMKQFTAFLEKSKPQHMLKTVGVLNDRIRLTACIQNLKEKIKIVNDKQTEIRLLQEDLKKHEEEMKKNKNFTVEVDEVYKDKEDIYAGIWWLSFCAGATCCTVCEENCHYPGCTVAWNPDHCEVMKDGHCTVCTKKCPVSAHLKKKWRYVTKTRIVKKTVEEMKEKFEKNEVERDKKLSLLENLEKEMNQLTPEKSQLLDESYQHVVSLEQIALKADSLSTIVHLDFLIEKMKEKRDTEKVQKLEEMRSRADEGTRGALRYKLDGF